MAKNKGKKPAVVAPTEAPDQAEASTPATTEPAPEAAAAEPKMPEADVEAMRSQLGALQIELAEAHRTIENLKAQLASVAPATVIPPPSGEIQKLQVRAPWLKMGLHTQTWVHGAANTVLLLFSRLWPYSIIHHSGTSGNSEEGAGGCRCG